KRPREIAGLLQIGGNRGCPYNRIFEAESLVAEEKERPVPDDRPPNRAAKLVVAEHRSGSARGVGKEVICRQRVIAEEMKHAAVNLVRAALGNDVDHGAAGVGVLGAEVIGLHPELLHRFDLRAVFGAVERQVGVVAAIESELILIRPRSIYGEELIMAFQD